jgi:CHAD domain-containing protein
MTDGRAALDSAASQPAGPGPDIGGLAADRIARAHRRVARLGASVTAPRGGGGPPADDLHSLRKRGKELRYLLEFFGSLYDPAAYRAAVRNLKGLQDCLGEFQDGVVQQEAIRGFAVHLLDRRGPEPAAAELAATLLALGELTAQVHARQRRARDDLAGRYARFARAGILGTLGITGRGPGS